MRSNVKVLSFTIFEYPFMVVVSFPCDIVTAYHMINMAALTYPCVLLWRLSWSVSQMNGVHVSALKIFSVCRLYSLAFMNTQMPANSKHIFLLVNTKSKIIVKAIFMDFLLLCSSWLFHVINIVAQHWYSRDWSPNSSTSHYQTPWKLLFLAI